MDWKSYSPQELFDIMATCPNIAGVWETRQCSPWQRTRGTPNGKLVAGVCERGPNIKILGRVITPYHDFEGETLVEVMELCDEYLRAWGWLLC